MPWAAGQSALWRFEADCLGRRRKEEVYRLKYRLVGEVSKGSCQKEIEDELQGRQVTTGSAALSKALYFHAFPLKITSLPSLKQRQAPTGT